MQVSIVQYDISWEDKIASQAYMNAMLDASPPHEDGFVLVPELCDVGFSMNLDAIVDGQTEEWARQRALRDRTWIQYGFADRDEDGRGLNCATIATPSGTLHDTYTKVHPFSHGLESRHYAGGGRLVLVEVGDLLVCPLICYDLRFPELWRLARRAGAQAFAIGASWPAVRQDHWRSLLIARAIENQAFVFGCNRCGSDPYLEYAGGSMIIDPTGTVLAEADDTPTLLQSDIDPSAADRWRDEFRCQDDVHDAFLGTITVVRSNPA